MRSPGRYETTKRPDVVVVPPIRRIPCLFAEPAEPKLSIGHARFWMGAPSVISGPERKFKAETPLNRWTN